MSKNRHSSKSPYLQWHGLTITDVRGLGWAEFKIIIAQSNKFGLKILLPMVKYNNDNPPE